MDLGIVKFENNWTSLLTKTSKTVKTVIKETDLNKFTISVKPVCLITLLKDPMVKKLILETTNMTGVCNKNAVTSKFKVKLNRIKYTKKNVAITTIKSIANTSHFDAYLFER
jgi:hypothetical protein